MMAYRKVSIVGTGMYVPERVVTNHDLAKVMETSDEWIQQRSGIKERRHVEPGISTCDLAHEASKRALEAAGCSPDQLDMIIVATLSPDHYFPGTSAFLQHRLGLETTPAMDIRCQCSGFLYALSIGQHFVSGGQYQRVLICGAECHSPALDMTTRGRDVAVLFGDGAGAAVLAPSEDENRGILSVHLHAQGEFAKRLWIEAPSMTNRPYMTHEMIDDGRIFPKMEGRLVYKHAVARLPEVIQEALGANQLQASDVDLFVFHQANVRINEHAAQVLGIPAEKLFHNIDRYGNCSAASIPMCLDECARSGRLRPGQLVCLAAFGSGFTWACALVRW
ncbi:MAG: beta-ketoacyl-ACP synthase III [Planctomycetota bacterium]